MSGEQTRPEGQEKGVPSREQWGAYHGVLSERLTPLADVVRRLRILSEAPQEVQDVADAEERLWLLLSDKRKQKYAAKLIDDLGSMLSFSKGSTGILHAQEWLRLVRIVETEDMPGTYGIMDWKPIQ